VCEILREQSRAQSCHVIRRWHHQPSEWQIADSGDYSIAPEGEELHPCEKLGPYKKIILGRKIKASEADEGEGIHMGGIGGSFP
jgi:hypothetical protein